MSFFKKLFGSEPKYENKGIPVQEIAQKINGKQYINMGEDLPDIAMEEDEATQPKTENAQKQIDETEENVAEYTQQKEYDFVNNEQEQYNMEEGNLDQVENNIDYDYPAYDPVAEDTDNISSQEENVSSYEENSYDHNNNIEISPEYEENTKQYEDPNMETDTEENMNQDYENHEEETDYGYHQEPVEYYSEPTQQEKRRRVFDGILDEKTGTMHTPAHAEEVEVNAPETDYGYEIMETETILEPTEEDHDESFTNEETIHEPTYAEEIEPTYNETSYDEYTTEEYEQPTEYDYENEDHIVGEQEHETEQNEYDMSGDIQENYTNVVEYHVNTQDDETSYDSSIEDDFSREEFNSILDGENDHYVVDDAIDVDGDGYTDNFEYSSNEKNNDELEQELLTEQSMKNIMNENNIDENNPFIAQAKYYDNDNEEIESNFAIGEEDTDEDESEDYGNVEENAEEEFFPVSSTFTSEAFSDVETVDTDEVEKENTDATLEEEETHTTEEDLDTSDLENSIVEHDYSSVDENYLNVEDEDSDDDDDIDPFAAFTDESMSSDIDDEILEDTTDEEFFEHNPYLNGEYDDYENIQEENVDENIEEDTNEHQLIEPAISLEPITEKIETEHVVESTDPETEHVVDEQSEEKVLYIPENYDYNGDPDGEIDDVDYENYIEETTPVEETNMEESSWNEETIPTEETPETELSWENNEYLNDDEDFSETVEETEDENVEDFFGDTQEHDNIVETFDNEETSGIGEITTVEENVQKKNRGRFSSITTI